LRLAGPGQAVIITYSNPASPGLRETMELLSSRAEASESIQWQAQEPGVAETRLEGIIQRYGRLDVLVNNAGITRDSLAVRMSDKDFKDVLDTNLFSAFTISKAAAKIMMKARRGRIVNISSVIGFIGNAGQVNYSAAKAGMVALTKSLAMELASRSVTVNAVAPGYIDTDLTASLPDKVMESLLSRIPAGRVGLPEEVAEAVAFLVSDGAAYITGQTLHVNGGLYM
jgi:3-oxoacyl-[acyl-carrier protein] reductase